LQAGRENVPVDDSYPDPCGVTTGMALAMALWAQEKTGMGQYLETTMLTASGYVHSGRLVRYEGAPELEVVDSEQCGLSALYRLYRCKSGWIFVAALKPQEWESLALAVGHGEWLSDPAFVDRPARRKNDTSLAAQLAEIFAAEEATYWEQELGRAGTPAASAADRTFEEFLVEEHLVREGEHPSYGTYYALPPRVRCSGVESLRGAPVTIGQHTTPLLHELGYTHKEIESFLTDKIVSSGGPIGEP
jgi:crotonobetainyl-CoA:carnitine CoA-transferase CaiB-like acyl-CoA transferase